MSRRLGWLALAASSVAWSQSIRIDGHVLDPQGLLVAGASIHLLISAADVAQIKSDGQGEFHFAGLINGAYTLRAEAPEFAAIAQSITVTGAAQFDLKFREIRMQRQNVAITAKNFEPTVDLRNAEVFNRTLFTRDDQVLQ